MFTCDSWRLNHIKLHCPEYLLVASHKNRTIRSVTRVVESGQCRDFNPNQHSAKEFNAVPNIKHIEYIADVEF